MTESKNEKSKGQEKAGTNFKNLEFRNKIKHRKRFERKERMRSSATRVLIKVMCVRLLQLIFYWILLADPVQGL